MKFKKGFLMIMAIMFVVLLAGCTFVARATVVYESPSEIEQLRIDMIQRVDPSVVAVVTETGHGSGIIYKKELIETEGSEQNRYLYSILTNHHVVENGGEMKIHFGPETEDIPVKDYQSYQLYDIAVVRIETTKTLRAHNIPSINDNVITEIVKGQDVIAIGTPRSLEYFNYVTNGVVSLVSYPYRGIVGLGLMHNAELNPGNSGGPLFNLRGDVIGINVAKIPDVQTEDGVIAAEGLNYSLSINKIAPVIRNFKEANYIPVVRSPRIGVTIQEVSVFLEFNDPELLPVDPVGVVIIGFDLTRQAHEVLELYDLIIKMNGHDVEKIADMASQLEGAEFGDTHELTVLRKVNDSFIEFTVTITLS